MRNASAMCPSGCMQRDQRRSRQLLAVDARHAAEDGQLQELGDLVRPADARVELLEQEDQADAGEQADAEARGSRCASGSARTAPSAPRPATGCGSCRSSALQDLQVLQALLEQHVVGGQLGLLAVDTPRADPRSRRRARSSGAACSASQSTNAGHAALAADAASLGSVLSPVTTTTLLPLADGTPACCLLAALTEKPARRVDPGLLQQDLGGAACDSPGRHEVADGGHLAVDAHDVRVAAVERVGEVDLLLVDTSCRWPSTASAGAPRSSRRTPWPR